MINSGGSGYKMIRKTHSEDDSFCDWIQRPFFDGAPAPTFDSDRIRDLEEGELAARDRAGAAFGRTHLPVVFNDRYIENPSAEDHPQGREPNPDLSGGEGMDPYELYSVAMDALAGERKTSHCLVHVRRHRCL